MKVVVFSGTTEGREFSKRLAALGADVLVSVATELGAEEQGSTPGVTVRAGRLEPDAMAALLRGAALCVDATHPYAVEATQNIRQAAQMAGVPCRRLLRPASPLPAGSRVYACAAEAAAALADTTGNILLATGATQSGIAACEAASIPHRNIIAMQGPFSQELNEALIRQFSIKYLVTKDGGAAGGFAEKAAAAAAAGTALVVLRRPAEQGETADEILQSCKEMIPCN